MEYRKRIKVSFPVIVTHCLVEKCENTQKKVFFFYFNNIQHLLEYTNKVFMF